MTDYAQVEKRKWLYSFKRKEMMLEATIIGLIGISGALILVITGVIK